MNSDQHLSDDSFNELIKLYDNSLESTQDFDIIHPLFSELVNNDDDYSIIEPIAKGGFKTIYKARHCKSQRIVAMAKLHEEIKEDFFDPFIREARLTALLDHPNIIKIYDLGIDKHQRPFFTMDLKVGHNLEELIKTKSTTLSHRLNLFLKICDAISYSHSKHILHLDIKPSNIQVGSYGELLICDWGLGRLMGDEIDEVHHELIHPDLLNHMTLMNEVKGTPGYMAPEQIEQTHKTELTDIYSLGVLLRTLILEQDFDEGSSERLLSKTLEGRWPHPTSIHPHLPKSLDGIVAKAMALKPKDRYQNVKELSQDVERVLQNFSPSTDKSSLFNELRLFYKRHDRLCNISLAFITLMVFMSFYFTHQLKLSRDDALQDKLLAEQRSQEARALSLKLSTEKELVESITLSLINTYLQGSSDFSDLIIYDNPKLAINNGLKTLEQIHQIDPEHEWAYMQKGYLNLIKLNFKAAHENFSKNANKAGDLKELSNTLLAKYSQGSAENSLTILNELFDKFMKGNKRIPFADKALSYERAINGFRKGLELPLQKLIKMLNQSWNYGFEYNTSNQTLILSDNIKTLSTSSRMVKLCILRHIPIKTLILNTPGFNSLDHLIGLDYLETLDLSHIKDIKLLKLPSLPQLRMIKVSEKTYQKEHDQLKFENIELLVVKQNN